MMFYALALFNVFVAAVAQMLLKKSRHHAAQIIHQGIPEPVGYGWVLADGILAGIERVCAELGRAAQGTRHHRGGQLPVRAGTGLRLLQGKNQPAQSCGNRAYLSGRRRVLLGVSP